MAEIEDLIQASLDQDFNRANEIFGDIMGLKIDNAFEQEKIRLANQIYNGVGEDEEFEDLEDEELEDLDEEEFDEEEDDSEVEN